MTTMKQVSLSSSNDRARGGGGSAAAATSSALLILATITSSHLIQGAHATTPTDGYEFVAVGGCRDTHNNIYSNIRLPDDTAATGNTACAQSCDVFRSSDGFLGYEYQVVFGSDSRCYCLFDSGTDVMTLAESVEGDTTVKADNLGFGEIQSAVHDGIDSYCYKVVEVVTEEEEEEEEEASSAEGTRQGDLDDRASPTPAPQTIDEIFEAIFTTSQVDDNYGVDGWNDITDHNNLNATKSSKIFAAHGGKVAKSKSGKASISMSMECPSSKSSKSSSMSHGMKQSGGGGGGGSSKKPSGGGDMWSDDGWGPSSTRAGDADMWSNGDSGSGSGGSGSYGKSEKSQSMKTKTTKVCSKSGKGMSYGLVEGKAGKGGGDDWSMAQMLEQMRYKMTSSGEKSVGIKWTMMMMMMTLLLIASFLMW